MLNFKHYFRSSELNLHFNDLQMVHKRIRLKKSIPKRIFLIIPLVTASQLIHPLPLWDLIQFYGVKKKITLKSVQYPSCYFISLVRKILMSNCLLL